MTQSKVGSYTGGVRQVCIFNIFPEKVMPGALKEHNEKVSIGDRFITNLRFVDNTDALAEEKNELEAQVEPRQNLHKV